MTFCQSGHGTSWPSQTVKNERKQKFTSQRAWYFDRSCNTLLYPHYQQLLGWTLHLIFTSHHWGSSKWKEGYRLLELPIWLRVKYRKFETMQCLSMVNMGDVVEAQLRSEDSRQEGCRKNIPAQIKDQHLQSFFPKDSQSNLVTWNHISNAKKIM